jgi:hypothetical protein
LLLLQTSPTAPAFDTLRLRPLTRPPAADGRVDSTWGTPPIRIATAQGEARAWLLRAADTVYVGVRVPDRTRSWSDVVSLYLDVAGGRENAPAHHDFQWALHRVLDSSVVYRGRAGQWEPPLGDPDWRLGNARSGGGWEVSAADDADGWSLVLRLDPAWLAGEQGRRPALGILIHDDDPNRWYSWPVVTTAAGATLLERTPALWVPVE